MKTRTNKKQQLLKIVGLLEMEAAGIEPAARRCRFRGDDFRVG